MTDDPLIGRQFGNYRIERPLGRGGMATVYSGTDVVLMRPVAIKVIDAHYRDQQAYAERFVHEARAVASWRHENIIQVYYAGDQDGLYYYVMEYIDGPDLAYLLKQYTSRGELVPQRDALHLGRPLASALDYAHARGVVHRDVKPSNVFIERSGRVVLGDFGLALNLELGSRGEVFGTPQYMAPEQARASNTAVPQSDLYSLGIIMYEMLAGQVPFDDLSPSAVALQHLTLPVPAPSQINPALSAEIDTVLLKALHKEPGERYPTGAALIGALQSALQANLEEGIPPVTQPIPGQIYNSHQEVSQVSIFQLAAEAPPALTTAPAPRGLLDLQKADPPGPAVAERKKAGQPAFPPKEIPHKSLAAIVIVGFAALALLCLLALLLPGALPGRLQEALPWGGSTEEAPGGVQGAPSETATGTFAPTPGGSTSPVETTLVENTPLTTASSLAGGAATTNPQPAGDCGPSITLTSESDSWIDQNSSSDNFGSDSILKVRSQGDGDNFRALVRFELPTLPPGCQVQSAALRLYSPSWKEGRTLEALQISTDWSEDSVRWNNQPQTSGLAATTDSGSDYLEWDVTSQILEMYTAETDFGFMIRDAEEGGSGSEQQFHSREKGETPPMLVIRFTPDSR
jgi:serine/threonine protein kinase